MADPFTGEIRMFAGVFAPRGYSFCDGQIMAISQYQALFSLIGSTFGGDGRNTFGLPDLRGRVPVGIGHSHYWGHAGGYERVNLTLNELPSHTHGVDESFGVAIKATTEQADVVVPSSTTRLGSAILPRPKRDLPLENYHPGGEVETVNLGGFEVTNEVTLNNIGMSYSHENMQPSLVINYIMAMNGTYPSRS